MVFPHFLSSYHPTIKFPRNTRLKKLSFVDVDVTKNGESKVETYLYTKPTDTQSLFIPLHVIAHLVKT